MSSKSDCVIDFVVVRVPRLSLAKIKELPNSEADICDYLSSWLASPGILEAIYLASPSLVARLDYWRNRPESKSGRKVTTALLKYLIRMSSRATPFGLFSGVALAHFADATEIKPYNMQLDRRKTRLDMFYLSTIQQQWAQSNEGQQKLRYVPNSTLYRLGSHLHYIESYHSLQRQYRLSSVECDEALDLMLQLADGGKPESELVEQFCSACPETAPEEVKGYLQQLIKEQVLVVELKLPLTNGQTDQAFVHELQRADNLRDSMLLQTVIDNLGTLDQKQTAQPNDYQAIVQKLKELPYPVSENKLFQTDSWRSMARAQLDKSLVTMLEKTLLTLKAQSVSAHSRFQEFITSFQQRFEGQFIPLLQLLDDEAGIPFSSYTGYETPLLAGVNIVNRQQRTAKRQSQSELEKFILKAMKQNARAECIQLCSNELLMHSNTTAIWQQLPASFAANISCYLDNDGKPLLHLHGFIGPSGANLLGRFCHLDGELQQKVRDYLSAEEALSPEVVFAEVVHMPDGRPGNVIARPLLRHYEIVFLADTLLPKEQQIPLQDLYVFIEAGQVKLWSKRLNKQVIPRLTSAHNYFSRSLGVYHFLCMLQHQQALLPHFSTPASFLQMDIQPRVQLDNVIIQEAQWQVERSMLSALVVDHKWQPDAWSALQLRYQLPRYVCYAVSDNVLTIDLHNPVMITVLLGETSGQSQIQLKESLAMQYQSMVASEEGPFAHEIIVPMINEKALPFVTLHPNPAKQLETSIQRRFAPGSEWLSLKVYAAQSTAELVLSETITPLLQQCQQQGLFRKWFFIRYSDPDWHLRIRLCGEPSLLYGQVLPLIQKHLASWLESCRVHKIELFTYQREIERYGGDAAMDLAEKVFQADSYFVLQILSLLRQHGESVRWRMALLGVDTMLTAFGYDLARKLELISGLRQGFGQEFQENAQLRTQLGKKYRNYQVQLRQDFQALESATSEPPLQQMSVIRQQFLQQLQPIVAEILCLQQKEQLSCSLDILLHSLLHMFNNRIFKAYGREQELVVYDFLRRHYLSQQSQPKSERG